MYLRRRTGGARRCWPIKSLRSLCWGSRASVMKIPQHVIDEMLAHARDEAPNECCGLLVGTRDSIERSIRARNREASPTRYLIDPEDHFAAIHGARTSGQRVVGA